jgi:CubicO group peptidase (beta-lactamase class C family)
MGSKYKRDSAMDPRILSTFRYAAICLLLHSHAYGSEWATAEPESVGMSAAPLAALAADMRAIVDRNERAAVVTLVARRGKIVHLQAYGMADREAGRPVTPDTIFRMCSMTRPITAAAAMLLYEAGKIKIDEPVSRHLPMFATGRALVKPGSPETEPARMPITVKQVLTHTTGYGYAGDFPDAIGITQDEILEAPSLMEAMTRLAGYPTLHQPGERWRYGFSTDILGAVVQSAAGEPYEDFVSKRIFEPLGMDHSVYRLGSTEQSRLVTTYSPAEDGGLAPSERIRNLCFQVDDDETVSPGGGLATSVIDYWRFIQMLLNRGELNGVRILQAATVDLMTQDHLSNGQGPLFWSDPGRFGPDDNRDNFNGYGYGFQVGVRLPDGDHTTPGSPGEFLWGGLADTTFFADEQEQIVAIALSQFLGPPSTMGSTLRQRVYESLNR